MSERDGASAGEIVRGRGKRDAREIFRCDPLAHEFTDQPVNRRDPSFGVRLSTEEGAALALDSSDWAEAEPGTAETPMCFFSAGMLADLMGRVSGETVAVMEVECRSRGDSICRFLSASPETLQEVYEKMTGGMSYAEALQA